MRYTPRPWTIQDSLTIAYQMVETLSISPSAALTREKVLAKLGPELTADLYVNTSWRDHPPTAPVALAGAPSHSRSMPSRNLTSFLPGAVPSSEPIPPL